MATNDSVFSGDIPRDYDEHLVPLIFEPYAADLARRVAARAPESVLELAAGSGVVARALLPMLGAEARYVVTDLNQPMLDYAARRQGADPRLTWRQADALDLPFPESCFAVVCCQFGVMFFPDRVRAYREVHRVLGPGGLFLFNVWDRIEHNVFAGQVTRALADLYPDAPPRFLARVPHGYHDVATIRADLAAAGFTDVTIDTRSEVSRATSALHAARAYCQGTPLRHEIEPHGPAALDTATRHAAAFLETRHGHGPISAEIRAHVVSVTRSGSAGMSHAHGP